MRNRLLYLRPVIHYLGALFWIFGFVLLVPLCVRIGYAGAGYKEVWPWAYLVPALLAWVLGAMFRRRWALAALDTRGAMLVCALGWISISALGAIPFWLGLEVSYLDAFFEAVSGFTTTGITMLQGVDHMPRSIIFWRAFIQWVGGLGILTFFLAVAFTGGTAHQLFSAESHKIFAKRPAPGLVPTLRILWTIYSAYTVLVAMLLMLEGVSAYDAVAHAMTALSTGGYSPHDASIDHFRQAGYAHYVLIEYTVTVGMLLGGVNFFIHYRLLTGGVRALWDNLEIRLFWGILVGACVLVALDHCMTFGVTQIGDTVRYALFQVVAIMTTTGFATKDIGTDYFPALAKQVFLVLMVVGGCVGSTGGGIKVLRIGVLFKMLARQMNRLIHGRSSVNLVVVDGEAIEAEEVRRIATLFFAWIVLLGVGAAVTALLSDLGPLPAASGMFSALGNIGPCYIPVDQMAGLHPVVKLTYIVGMLAGRLEVLPIMLLFARRTWR